MDRHHGHVVLTVFSVFLEKIMQTVYNKNMETSNTKREENLLVVVAVEEYSRRHGISAHETLKLFLKFNITDLIRKCYNTLHTQDIYECVEFAEDILKRENA